MKPKLINFRIIWKTLILSWNSSHRYFILSLIFTILVAGSQLLLTYTLKLIVDSVTNFVSNDCPSALIAGLCLFLGLYTIVEFITELAQTRKILYDRIHSALIERFIIKDLCRIVYGQRYEKSISKNYQDDLSFALGEANDRATTLNRNILEIVSTLFLTLSTSIIIIHTSTALIIIPLLSVLYPLYVHYRLASKELTLTRELIYTQRLTRTIMNLLLGLATLKDILILNAKEHMLNIYDSNLFKSLNIKVRFQSQRDIQIALSNFSRSILIMLNLFLLIYFAYKRTIHVTVGEIIFLLQLNLMYSMNLERLISSISSIINDSLFLEKSLIFTETPIIIQSTPSSCIPLNKIDKIEFCNLTFSYCNNNTGISNFNLVLNRGETLLITGNNGIGKSTLLYLLLGYFKPQKGCIRINGNDLNHIDLHEYYKKVSVLFQDSKPFEGMSIRENIELGGINATNPEETNIRELMLSFKMDTLLNKCPEGIDTILGLGYENDFIPSIGEQRFIAVARTFLNSSSDVIILDEPFSNLDKNHIDIITDHIKNKATDKLLIIVSPTGTIPDSFLNSLSLKVISLS